MFGMTYPWKLYFVSSIVKNICLRFLSLNKSASILFRFQPKKYFSWNLGYHPTVWGCLRTCLAISQSFLNLAISTLTDLTRLEYPSSFLHSQESTMTFFIAMDKRSDHETGQVSLHARKAGLPARSLVVLL